MHRLRDHARDLALAARTTPADPAKPIYTYALQVLSSGGDGSATALAVAGSPALTYNPVPGESEIDKKNAFQQVVNRVGSCLYNATGDVPTDADLNYADPLTAQQKLIKFSADCTSDTSTADGWGKDPSPGTNRIIVCGKACTDYQKALSDGSSFTLLYGQPAVPVPMYFTPKGCASR